MLVGAKNANDVLYVTYKNNAQVNIGAGTYASATMATSTNTTGYKCVGMVQWYVNGSHARVFPTRIAITPPSASNGSFAVDLSDLSGAARTLNANDFIIVYAFVKI